MEELLSKYPCSIKNYEFHKALGSMWTVFDETNKYIADSKPWDMFKSGDISSLNSVILPVLEVIRMSTFLLSPVMPVTCMAILDEFGLNVKKESIDSFCKWGAVNTMSTKYVNKKFFNRIELVDGGN